MKAPYFYLILEGDDFQLKIYLGNETGFATETHKNTP